MKVRLTHQFDADALAAIGHVMGSSKRAATRTQVVQWLTHMVETAQQAATFIYAEDRPSADRTQMTFDQLAEGAESPGARRRACSVDASGPGVGLPETLREAQVRYGSRTDMPRMRWENAGTKARPWEASHLLHYHL